MPRVIHFEIYGEAPETLIAFYEQVFAWQFERWGPMEYWIIKTGKGPGIDGGLGKERSPSVITIDVPDVDVYLTKIQASGGTVVVLGPPGRGARKLSSPRTPTTFTRMPPLPGAPTGGASSGNSRRWRVREAWNDGRNGPSAYA